MEWILHEYFYICTSLDCMKNTSLLIAFFLLASVIILHNSCLKEVAPLQKKPTITVAFCDSLNVKYSTDVAPIMQGYCVGCHFTGGQSPDLTNYSGVQGAALNNTLYDRAVGPNADMPSGGPLLADSLRQKLDCWIQKGALNN